MFQYLTLQGFEKAGLRQGKCLNLFPGTQQMFMQWNKQVFNILAFFIRIRIIIRIHWKIARLKI